MGRRVQESDSPERMLRVLVCPHDLVMGGSQINAIDLASRIRDRGHEVHLYAPPGELSGLIADRKLCLTRAPAFSGDSLSVHAIRSMVSVIRDFRPDIVHTYESSPTLVSAVAGVIAPHREVATVLSMTVPDFIPRHVPLFVGTSELAEGQASRSAPTLLMEPPIDTDHDRPGDAAQARRDIGVDEHAFVVSVVGRLSFEHQKAQGVAEAIIALAASADHASPTVLLVAGAGDDEETVRAAAAVARSNPNLVVRLLGNVPDPRAVYDAADVVFGMGSSALRAMSHAKPLIVQGTDGYWKLFSPASAEEFFRSGLFGTGRTGESAASIIADLRRSAGRCTELGRFGRDLVVRRYSLENAAQVLERTYRSLMTESPHRHPGSALGTVLRYARFRAALGAPGVRRVYRRLAGRDV